MKSLYIITACLCLYAFSVHSQTDNVADGNYVFGKAVVTAYNYDTQAEVFTRTFNDVGSLSELPDLPFPVEPVFLSAFIQKGVLTGCKLWNNNKEYSVQENGHLLVSAKQVSDDQTNGSSEQAHGTFDPFLPPYYLSPIYTLDLDAHTAVFTFTEPYGSSAFNFPLKGKLVITLVREENN